MKKLSSRKGRRQSDSPPKDYDNRLLGYCIIEATPGLDLVVESRRLEQMLEVRIEGNV